VAAAQPDTDRGLLTGTDGTGICGNFLLVVRRGLLWGLSVRSVPCPAGCGAPITPWIVFSEHAECWTGSLTPQQRNQPNSPP
jgi:hypothetical protein